MAELCSEVGDVDTGFMDLARHSASSLSSGLALSYMLASGRPKPSGEKRSRTQVDGSVSRSTIVAGQLVALSGRRVPSSILPMCSLLIPVSLRDEAGQLSSFRLFASDGTSAVQASLALPL